MGEIGRAVESLRLGILAARTQEATAEAARATAEPNRHEAQANIASGIEQAIGGVVAALADAAVDLGRTTDRVTEILRQSARRADATALQVGEVAGNIQAVAATRASDSAVAGPSLAASRIGDVVRLISDIAGQTNLLALNATIEAARAGAAAKATEEIRNQIDSMRAATEGAVGSMRGIADAVGRIEAVTGPIAAALDEQDAVSQVIARNAAVAAGGTSEAAEGITRLNQELAVAASGIGQVCAAGNAVTQLGTALRSEVTGFVARLRAG